MNNDHSIYYMVGFTLIANIGTIVSVITIGGRSIWNMSRLVHKIELMEKHLNGFGERVKEVEKSNHSLDNRLSVMESKIE